MNLTVLRSSILGCFPESQLVVRISDRWKEQPRDVAEEGNRGYVSSLDTFKWNFECSCFFRRSRSSP
ncbi:hypothetical protein EON65_43615 [archaeon]|nr:MAG: hypothetical protein EON65_43615 [archaeon]